MTDPTVTNAGLDLITLILNAAGASEPNHVGWGTGTTGSVVADTALETEDTTDGRVAGTSSQQTTDTTDDTYRVVGTITASATRAITESGLFDQDDAGGNMLCRGTFSAINVVNLDTVQFTWNVDFDIP